jgi:radical SAM-linked protein
MIHRLRAACRQIKREPGITLKHNLDVHVTLSNFVPKPHTPFQWFPQDAQAQLKEKIAYLKAALKGIPGIKLSFTDTELSKLEAVVSKGDVDLAPVFERAYRKGAYLDAWGGAEALQAWFDALADEGIDPEAYTRDRLVDPAEPLPWDAIDVGLTKTWLQQEYQKAVAAASTTPCFDECSVCGVCAVYSTQPKFIEVPQGGFKVRQVNREKPKVLQAEPVARLRMTLEKKGLMRFISHLDWLRMLTRVITRAKLPIAYSQGFNPKPKLSFSPALPLFAEAWREIIDVELTDHLDNVDDWIARLNRQLPSDGHIVEAVILPRVVPSIQKSIRSYGYQATRSCKNNENSITLKERLMWMCGQQAWLLPVDDKGKPVSVEAAYNPVSSSGSNTPPQFLDIRPYLHGDIAQVDEQTIAFQLNVTPNVSTAQRPDTVDTRYINPKWLLSQIDAQADWHLVRTQIVLA